MFPAVQGGIIPPHSWEPGLKLQSLGCTFLARTACKLPQTYLVINIRVECCASFISVSQQHQTQKCCIGVLQRGERHSAVAGRNCWQWSSQAPHSSSCKSRQACSRPSPFIPTSAIRYCIQKARSFFLLFTQICLLDSPCRRQITAKWNWVFTSLVCTSFKRTY